MPLRLAMVVDNLKKVMIRIFKDHENALVFKNDLRQLYYIRVVQF